MFTHVGGPMCNKFSNVPSLLKKEQFEITTLLEEAQDGSKVSKHKLFTVYVSMDSNSNL